MIEMMIAIFIFGVILLSSGALASSYLNNRTALRKEQQDMEELSLTINYLAKRIRMSNWDTCSPNCMSGYTTLVVNDNTTDVQYTYVFDNTNSILTENGTTIISGVTGSFTNKGTPSAPLIVIDIQKEDRPLNKVRTAVSQRAGYLQPD